MPKRINKLRGMKRKKNDEKERGVKITRRRAAALAAAGAGWLLSGPRKAPAQYMGPEVQPMPTFFFTQLRYGEDMSWNPYPTAARSLMQILVSRTSVQASTDRVDLGPGDPRLFHHPFLYWTGTREFEPLPEEQVKRLKLFLEMGGFMLVDDALSATGVGFDKSVKREISRMFPGQRLSKVPEGHTINQSYYLLSRAAGRTANVPYLLGINLSERTPLVYSANDLGGAWARDRAGQWLATVKPGGEMQREKAIRLGINLVMYALCVNYKQDMIHVPFISKRRKGL